MKALNLVRLLSAVLFLSAASLCIAKDAPAGDKTAALLAGYMQRADSMAARKDYSDAHSYYRKIYKKNPDSPEAPIALKKDGDLYFQLKKYKKAFKCYSDYLTKYPGCEDYQAVLTTMFQIGNLLLSEKTMFGSDKHSSIRKAIEIFNDVQAKSLDNTTITGALYNGAVANFKIKNYDEAISNLEQVSSENRARDEVRYLLCRCYYELARDAGHNQIAIDNALFILPSHVGQIRSDDYRKAVAKMYQDVFNWKARHYAGIAHFYEKTGHPDAAKIYRLKIIKEFATTEEAQKAKEKV